VIVRELFAKLGLNVDAQSFAKGEIAASIVKGALTKLVETVGEVAHKFVEVIQQTAEYGKETKEAAQATGLTTASLQQLRGVAKALGLESADLDTGIFKLSRTMYAAKKGGDEQGKVFAKLGVKYKESNGQLKNADDVLLGIATAFQKMPDGAEKTAMAMEVFGRSGARLIPMLNKGEDGINGMRSSMVVMTDAQLEAGEELIKTQRQLTNVTARLWKGAIAPLLPALNELLKRSLAWRKGNAEIMRQRIQQYLGYAIKAVQGLADAFSFLVRNAAAVKALVIVGLVYGFSQLSTASVIAAGRTALAWIAAAAPFIALAALVAGILLVFDDIRVYQAGGKSLYGRFKKEIDDWMKPRDQDPWFVAAIKSFVRLLDQAIKLINEFYEATGMIKPATIDKRAGLSDKAIKYNAAVQTQKAAQTRAQLGLPLTDEQKKAIALTGGTEESFMGRYGAKGPLPPPSPDQLASPGGPVLYRPDARGPVDARQLNVSMPIYPTPGMDEEMVGKIAADKIDERWNNEMEAAAAAAGP
jgi:hypothetical protein